MIFCLRQIQETCTVQDRPLHIVFFDFSKAFDTDEMTGLWHILRKNGSPEKFTTMIEALHTGNLVIVQYHKWGQARLCTGLHALLHLPISNARWCFTRHGGGVYIQSRHNADLFNVAHFRAKTTRILMRELLFADDSALVAHSAEEMQKIVDAFSDASKKFCLKINITANHRNKICWRAKINNVLLNSLPKLLKCLITRWKVGVLLIFSCEWVKIYWS